MRTLKQITEELAERTKDLNPLAVKFVDGSLQGEEVTQFRTLKSQVETLMGEKADAERSEQERREDLAFIERAQAEHQRLNAPASGAAARQVPRDERGAPASSQRNDRYVSMGEAFIDSDQFKQYRDGGVGQGGSSRRVSVDYRPAHQRALITSTTVTDVIMPQRIPGIYQDELQELTLRDALPNGRTDSNMVEFVREASRTNNAAEVAEATSLVTGLKPESGFTLEPDTAPVRTIATLMYVTRNALDDMAGLRSYIDNLLARFIDERVDRQLLIGDGVAPNLLGLNNVSGVQDLNGAYFTTTMPSRADRVRRAITEIRLAGRGRAGLVVMNPMDVEYFELLKSSVETGVEQNAYALPGGGPFGAQAGVPTIWGRRIVEHEDQSEGVATVLDPRATMVMDRMDTQLFATDSNRDLFERNIITILAETRLAFPIFFPARIALVDLTATA